MESQIRKAIENACPGVGFTLERPTEESHGDYMTNVALVAAKKEGKKSHDIAETIAKALQGELHDVVSRVEVAGPGFINLTLSRSAVTALIAEADARGSEWGKGSSQKNKRVMVEYSNPNAFKEMHIGHLVGTVIGEALSRLIENEGAQVARDTFGGDIGPNVAKAIWALTKAGIADPSAEDIGKAYIEGSKAYEADPAAKAEIDALNQAIYQGEDSELMSLWKRGREVSMTEFRRLWQVLGTHFDFEFFDSDTTDSARRIVDDGLHKGVFEKSDGAIIYNGEGKGVHTMVFITSHNTPTYEAKDLGLAFLKEERWPSDQSIIVTGNEQSGRFKTVLRALSEIAPLLAEKTMHVPTGFLRLSSGKMSSREGNTIGAREFLQEVIAHASKKNPDPVIREQVAIGAAKFMILRQSPGSDIVFDQEKSLSLEGDSGPYLQYALVRAASVIASKEGGATDVGTPDTPYVLERLVIHFPEVAARAASECAPNLLVNYLLELSGAWNAFYAKERIIGGAHESHKLLVARAFLQTMRNGLTLLGIPIPEKM